MPRFPEERRPSLFLVKGLLINHHHHTIIPYNKSLSKPQLYHLQHLNEYPLVNERISTLKRDHLNGKFHFPSINLARNTGNHTATILRIPRIYSADIPKISLENQWLEDEDFLWKWLLFWGHLLWAWGWRKPSPQKQGVGRKEVTNMSID